MDELFSLRITAEKEMQLLRNKRLMLVTALDENVDTVLSWPVTYASAVSLLLHKSSVILFQADTSRAGISQTGKLTQK